MAASQTAAVILPHTGYILRIELPPVRRLIESGVIVALGSDANPNAFSSAMVRQSESNRFSTCLRLVDLDELGVRSLPDEFARSVGRRDDQQCGRTRPLRSLRFAGSGKESRSDRLSISGVRFLFPRFRFDSISFRWEHIIYQFGDHSHLIRYVLKHGQIVHSSSPR